MDGNNSLKRLDFRGDRRGPFRLDSRYLLPRELVEQQKDKLTSTARNCADSWKASRETVASKDSFEWVDETGIFLIACEHSVIRLYTDMIKEGERRKHPLALVRQVLATTTEQAVVFGYDIGCSFSTTMALPGFRTWLVNREVSYCESIYSSINIWWARR